jgi:hypothetical protein
MGTQISMDVLISAIAITVAIFSPFFNRDGIRSIPVLGENIMIRNVNVNEISPSQ